jgi:uncharacterized UBP type Zn finger protein
MPRCDHFAAATVLVAPSDVPGCPECLERGDTWVHLRMCLECGRVGCCDSSPNQHARRHHESGDHNLIRSIEPGEEWAYCYVHDQYTRLAESETAT